MPYKKTATKKVYKRRAKKSNALIGYNMKPTVSRNFARFAFPDITRVKAHCQIQATLAGEKHYNVLIKGNSLHYVGLGLTYGFPIILPSFGSNFYSNLGYLLSPNVVSGGGGAGQIASRCPYSKYRILDSKITAKITSANSSNSYGCNVVLLPTNDPTGWSGLNQTTLAEQDLAKHKLVPPNTTGKNIVLKSQASTMKMFGLRYPSQLEDIEYGAFAGYDPGLVWYWMLDIQSYATDVSVAYECVIDIYADVECYDKNIQTSIEYGGSVA